MLPALTTKPKQAVRQVKGLTNDSIDSYSNTPLGGGSGMGATYVDNTESGGGTARGSPPSTSRSTVNTGRTTGKAVNEEGATMARVMRDRKASGEEELSLRTGDLVKVLSTKRTGYLKCEVGDEVGYVPSSYLEFLDGGAEAENANSKGTADEEAQRAAEKQRKKQKKEKRKKEKREANDASEPEEAAPVTARSPRKEVTNAEDESIESPRKSRKKNRKHRPDREAVDETQRGGVEEPSSSARSRAAPEETERSRSKSKHAKKKRHRDVDSSESSDSDGAKRSARQGRRRRHRRGSSASESESTSSGDSDASYRRRRRRRRHRHRRTSSEEEDEDDSDYKRRSRRGKKRRDKNDNDSEPEEGSRSARKAEKKKQAATLQEVEKGVGQLDMKSDEKTTETKTTKKEEPDRDRGKKDETERSEGSSEGRATNVSSSRKDDEGRTSSSTTSSSKQNGGKSTLGRQIGDRMRSFLGGGSKKQHSSKNSSGILNACPGTVQGEEGWYEHGENERYYFVLVDGTWGLLYGPMTEDDFEVFSNRVLEQNRAIELPPTYLHKSGYYLNREQRVQREQ
ncbi:hypothetical protein PR001_g1677 [Phytophthora rubi]|uniref:SH3 domain-containing protein n=1 Tax=Phytophthora rubi TaxID=129364 RepID=A0A6A3NYY4_9STRA|nr:hypothetical protein PR002_g1759 [Phytophthora rubi]KAE9051187.1 hypothetical protein PR001_g1677 [Phytophthora rubi]